jgi:hypothetical protein
MTILEVVRPLFCADKQIGTKVLCYYFDKKGVAHPAFKVAIDNDGYFEDKFQE